jgi:Glycosyl hydrolases family 2
MSNGITQIEIRNRSLTPAEAEVWLTVQAETTTAATEVRGRLMGPSCLYSNTVEVAYPLRSLPHPPEGISPLTRRVVIPEVSLWEPESPFLYRGPVELWQDGQRCARVTVQYGFCSSSLTPRGLRWNGKLLPLRGREVSQLTDDIALSLRHAGCNLLLAPVAEAETWSIADRLGFLVIGKLAQLDDAGVSQLERLATHPSCLGWLVEGISTESKPAPQLGRLGFAVSVPASLPPWAAFAVCDGAQAGQFAGCSVPLLVRGEIQSLAPPIVGTFW